MKLPSLFVVGFAFLISAFPNLAADTKVRNDAASEKLGLKLALQCYTFRMVSFFETVDLAAKMGIKYLEIYPGQNVKPGSKEKIGTNMSEKTVAEIKKKLADAGGLKLVAFGVAGIPTDEKGARKMFDWAKGLGIEVLVTETTPNDVIDKLTKEFNIKVALHNHPNSWPAEKVLKACENCGPLVGACADTGHWMRANRIPVETLRKLKGKIMSLHIKDLNEFIKGHDVPWGKGKGNMKGILRELKDQCFTGYLSIEYEHGGLNDLTVNLPLCIRFFDQTMKELAK